MPMIDSLLNDITILTHKTATHKWQQKGIKAVGYYELVSKNTQSIISSIKDADMIFWSSYSQYKAYHEYAKASVIHGCAGGETATLLIEAEVNPLIFPTIKSFEQWRAGIL